MKSLVNALIECGLSPTQSRAYLSVLQLGSASASQIAEHSKVKRVTCYAALQDLINIDLVSSDDGDAVRMFSAKPLSQLETHFMSRAQNAINAYRRIQALIPDLKLLANKTIEHPEVEYLDGKEIIQNYLNTLPKENSIGCIFVSQHGHYELFLELLKRAAEQNIRPRAIVPNSIKMNLLTYLDHRVVPARIAHFPSTTLIMKDRVIIVFDDGNFLQAVVMCDKNMVDHYQMLFDLNWRMLSGEHLISAHLENGA